MVRGEDREFGVAAQADRTIRHGSTAGCGEDNGRDLDDSCGRCRVWRFGHTAWHYFGMIPSAAVLVAFYLIAVAPLLGMREVYRRLGRWLLRRRIRAGLEQSFADLLLTLGQEPPPLPFRLSRRMQRGLIRLAQGLEIVTEVTALLVLFPMFKS